MQTSNPNLLAIRRIFVDDLFGQFTYDLRQEHLSHSNHLFIIYGDNGSGKTTLLKLIFHMLTSEEGHGHKSFLAHTQFKTLIVELEDGRSIVAHRNDSALTGSYNLSVKSRTGSSTEIFFNVDKDNTIHLTPNDEEYPQYLAVMESLLELGLSLYFLQDDRKVWSDLVRQDQGETTVVYYDESVAARPHRRRIAKQPPPILERAIDRFVWTVKNQAFQASTVGDFNVSTIYNDIARSIANSPLEPNEMHIESPVYSLIKTLEEQSDRSEAFAKFGLSSQLSIGELLSILHSARMETLPLLTGVLTPYVNAIKARLDAVEATYDSVRSLVEGINSFYTNKEVSFDFENGVRIHTSRGEALNPNSLSSGEQQLLLLFCNALTVQHRPTLFLIDEPELSLNVKWQRQLIQALLRTTSGRPIQFVLATHSLELLALHGEHVVKLTSVN